MDFKNLVDKVLNSDKRIRFVTVFNMYGEILEKNQSTDIGSPVLTIEDTEKLLRESASSWHYREELAYKLGKGRFSLVVYDKLTRITMPINSNHLLLVTIDNDVNQPEVVTNIKHTLAENI